MLKDGEPCDHPGCLSHRSHPCEGCGRIGGKMSTTDEQLLFCKELVEVCKKHKVYSVKVEFDPAWADHTHRGMQRIQIDWERGRHDEPACVMITASEFHRFEI